eukprot:15603523-Heterocapsa_arctica.AAC.1
MTGSFENKSPFSDTCFELRFLILSELVPYFRTGNEPKLSLEESADPGSNGTTVFDRQFAISDLIKLQIICQNWRTQMRPEELTVIILEAAKERLF